MGFGLTTSYETSGGRNNPNGIRPANQRGSHTHVQFNGDHREAAAANEGGPTPGLPSGGVVESGQSNRGAR